MNGKKIYFFLVTALIKEDKLLFLVLYKMLYKFSQQTYIILLLIILQKMKFKFVITKLETIMFKFLVIRFF